MKRILLISFCICSSILLRAQDSIIPRPGIALLAKANQNEILLRWAASSPAVWKVANQYGMRLERYTIVRDGKTLPNPEKLELPVLFKPKPLAEWEALSDQDSFALAAAQALYGESFEITETFSSKMEEAISKTKELEQRHWVATYCADQSRKVAEMSGLFYQDKQVKKNEKYLYAVFCNAPASIIEADTGIAFIGLLDYFPLPKPIGLLSEHKGNAVLLSWEGKKMQHFYNSYWVYRSDDGGKKYSSLTETPVVTPADAQGNLPEFLFKGDSVPEYNKTYLYKVVGVDPFGDLSPGSDSISVMCNPELYYEPHIVSSTPTKDGKMFIRWSFPSEARTLIDGFYLERCSDTKGPFETIVNGIKATDSIALDPKPMPSNYYRITVYDKYGNKNSSTVSLAQLEDTIPPAVPKLLKGIIDTLGLVRLNWAKNNEPDFVGYRVYRSNFKGTEYIQVSRKTVVENFYVDTLQIKTLTKEVHYKLVAIDNRYNPSDFSEVLTLERPDVVPPASPRMSSGVAMSNGIQVSWIRSSSSDVVKQVVYRKSAGDKGWVKLVVLDGNQTTEYRDTVSVDKIYSYTLVALDKAGNESAPAQPVSVDWKNKNMPEVITDISLKVDREKNLVLLDWKYKTNNIKSYTVYRSEGAAPIEVYKVLEGDNQRLEDRNVKMNTEYTYRVQVMMKDGKISGLSKEVKTKF